MEHRTKDGRLVARQARVRAPEPLTCIRFSCYLRFLKRVFWYVVLSEYHKRRAEYAEKHRDEAIPEKYRTGEDAPEGWHLFVEIFKLRGGLL
jgi:hypothetical protein